MLSLVFFRTKSGPNRWSLPPSQDAAQNAARFGVGVTEQDDFVWGWELRCEVTLLSQGLTFKLFFWLVFPLKMIGKLTK